MKGEKIVKQIIRYIDDILRETFSRPTRRASVMVYHYLWANAEARSRAKRYTISTWAAYNVRGRAAQYLAWYEDALKRGVDALHAHGLVRVEESARGGVAYTWQPWVHAALRAHDEASNTIFELGKR